MRALLERLCPSAQSGKGAVGLAYSVEMIIPTTSA